MIAKTQSNYPLNINFSHRLAVYGVDSSMDDHLTSMANTVDAMQARATSVLKISQQHFTSENIKTTFDEAMYFSLEAVQKELLDISQLVWAYTDLINDFHHNALVEQINKANELGGSHDA